MQLEKLSQIWSEFKRYIRGHLLLLKFDDKKNSVNIRLDEVFLASAPSILPPIDFLRML